MSAGHPLEDMVATMIDIGKSGTGLVSSTVAGVRDRASSYGSRGGVEERTDPTSYLVTPVTQENWVEDLRWKAEEQASEGPEAFDPAASAQELQAELEQRVAQIKRQLGIAEGSR